MKRFFRRLVAAWRMSRRVRWTVNTLGGLLGVNVLAVGVGFIRQLRAKVAGSEDAPEYAGDITLNPLHGLGLDASGFHWPQWAVDMTILAVTGFTLLAVLTVVLLARMPMRKPDNGFDRDPRRYFTDADREHIIACTSGQCEHRMLGLFRCHRPGGQMDHHYPWSHGGATSRRNLVWLCATHNRRKSDRIPTRLYTRLLEHAREDYWPVWARDTMILDGLADTTDDTTPDMDDDDEDWPGE